MFLLMGENMELADYLALQNKNGIRKIKRNSYKESDEQIHFIHWLNNFHPEVISIVCPVVSYGANFQRMKHWSLMKRLGFTKGTPDIFIPIAKGKFHGLFIEMKIKGGKVSDDQDLIINKLLSLGYEVYVCYTADEAVRAFSGYFKL